MMINWRNWSGRLGLAIALAIGGSVSSSYYTWAQSNTKINSSLETKRGGAKVIYLAGELSPPTDNTLLLISLSCHTTANNVATNTVKVYVEGIARGTYVMQKGATSQLNITTLFNNSVTIELVYVDDYNREKSLGKQTIKVSDKFLPLQFTKHGANYTLPYQVQMSLGSV